MILKWLLGNARTVGLLMVAASFLFLMGQSKIRAAMLDTARQALRAALGAIEKRDESHDAIVAAFESREAADEERRLFSDDALGALAQAGGGVGLDPALRAAYERVYVRWQKRTGGQGLRPAGQPADLPRTVPLRTP